MKRLKTAKFQLFYKYTHIQSNIISKSFQGGGNKKGLTNDFLSGAYSKRKMEL